MRIDIESWEDHADLHDRKDYVALVALCESELASSPRDLHAVERLADAYVLNGDFAKAINLLTPIHHEYPDLEGFSHLILDALFAQGKTETDYPWVIAPTILRNDKSTADACYEYLKPKRKPRSVGDLHTHLVCLAYLMFTEHDLFTLLRADPRFAVTGSGSFDARISVGRRRKDA